MLLKITLFPEPAFFVRVEKRVHEVVSIVLGDFERFRLYTFVQTLRKRKVLHFKGSLDMLKVLEDDTRAVRTGNWMEFRFQRAGSTIFGSGCDVST